MIIIDPQQVAPAALAFEGASGVTCRVLIGRQQGAARFAMRHYSVEPGGHTPLHRHNYEHEVLILDGQGLVRCGDTYRGVHPGLAVYLAPNELHQFRNTGLQPLRFLCVVPVEFDCASGTCQPTPGT